MARILYLTRHGEAESQEKDAVLSALGRFQARHAALRLSLDLWESDWRPNPLVQFYYSPIARAVETHQIMHDRVRTNHEYFPLQVRGAMEESRIRSGGVIGSLMKSGIPYKECVEHWLCNPGKYNVPTPDEICKKLVGFLEEQSVAA